MNTHEAISLMACLVLVIATALAWSLGGFPMAVAFAAGAAIDSMISSLIRNISQ